MQRAMLIVIIIGFVCAGRGYAADGFHQQIATSIDRVVDVSQDVCRACHASGAAADARVCLDCHDDKQSRTTAASVIGQSTDLHGNHSQVECTDCHDPHNGEPGLLKVSNQQSALCLSCHAK